MISDPHILSKIGVLSAAQKVEPGAVIALLALSALANSDMRSLRFWATAARAASGHFPAS